MPSTRGYTRSQDWQRICVFLSCRASVPWQTGQASQSRADETKGGGVVGIRLLNRGVRVFAVRARGVDRPVGQFMLDAGIDAGLGEFHRDANAVGDGYFV